MKGKLKIIAAALAAVTAMSCMAAGSSAKVWLETENGITYRYSQEEGSCVQDATEYTGWAKNKAGDRFYYLKGKRLKNTWLSVNGERTYYLDSKGIMLKNRSITKNGTVYSFDTNGRIIGEDVSQWGITVAGKYITRENLTFDIKRDKSADANEVTWGEEFGIQRLGEDGKWEYFESVYDSVWALDDVMSYIEAGGKVTRKAEWAYMYDSLENGTYRLVKVLTHREPGKKYSRSNKLYIEFEINDNTEHAFYEPPALLVNGMAASTSTYSWECAYPDGRCIGTDCDCLHPLDESCRKHTPVIKAKAGDKLAFMYSSDAAPSLKSRRSEPDSVTAERWTYDDWGNTEAKTEKVELKEQYIKFSQDKEKYITAEKGNYIYYIKAHWNGTSGTDGTGCMSGTVYYVFCVEAE